MQVVEGCEPLDAGGRREPERSRVQPAERFAEVHHRRDARDGERVIAAEAPRAAEAAADEERRRAAPVRVDAAAQQGDCGKPLGNTLRE